MGLPAEATENERTRLYTEAEIYRRLLGRGERLDPFVRRMAPHHPPPDHVAPLIEAIETARKERTKLCISWPPRHAKTHTTIHGRAWWLTATPADTCGYFSYSDAQARSKSRLIRDLALRAGGELSSDSANLAEWRTTRGGGLLAGGAGAGLTGQGVSGLMVVDDPFKNPAEAESPLIREKIWEWFNGVVMTRLEGASALVIHTRWHEDDLIGRLSKMPEWRVMNYPAVAELPTDKVPDDPLGRKPGDALWPDRWPIKELDAIRAQIGDHQFASLYQGRPKPKGSNIFRGETYYDPAKQDWEGWRIIAYLDPAASKKTTADYSAMVALAVKGHKEKMQGRIREVYRKQEKGPQVARDAVDFSTRNWNTKIGVEAVGGFKMLPDIIRELDPRLNGRIIEDQPKGDKWQRAQPVAQAWNDGRIMVPNDSPPWLLDFLHELHNFTGVNDARDDQVDALSGAWNLVAMASAPIKRGATVAVSRWR